MEFTKSLVKGKLIKRYKRFFTDVKLSNEIVTAHCPNTGSMKGLLKEGNKVWVSKTNNFKRKLKYTLQIIEVNKKKIGINTHSTNKIVLDALKKNRIKELKKDIKIKTEVKFGKKTRFDFLISTNNYKAFIEVKNVTLSRQSKVAEFPDSVTSRGSKHIEELLKASKKGYKIFILFVIQRDDCEKFKIASDIDPLYSKLLDSALKKKLNIICYDCKFLPKGIKLNKKIKFNE